jgi:hypothetical protein
MIEVRYINRNGSGYADLYHVADGTTVDEFIRSRSINPSDYTIRMKRIGVEGKFVPSAIDVLKNEDFISAIPKRMEVA